jgi:DNA-binding IclR family transcriptional regulator
MAIAHRVPVIDRMMVVLGRIERAAAPPYIRELAAGTSRSTVYRILDTLVAHGVIARRGAGCHVLGPRARCC